MTAVAQPSTHDETDAGTRPGPPAAAKSPVGPGVITAVGVLLALGLVALGVVAVHDALVPAALAGGPAWIDSAIDGLDGLEPAPWMVPAGIAMVIVGAWALVIALRPRRSTAIALAARTGVYLRPKDVARIARTSAEDVDGVTSARASATRRAVTLRVRATATGQVAADVRAAVAEALSPLAVAPKVRVRVTTEGGAR